LNNKYNKIVVTSLQLKNKNKKELCASLRSTKAACKPIEGSRAD